jgi:TetR/AcrR family transcriptional regulator, transcriptional repressor for nem operon
MMTSRLVSGTIYLKPNRWGEKRLMAKKISNRERIAEAAWDLFWLKGYYATSINDIAERAKLPKGSVYNYFVSKDALLTHVLGRLKYQTETELRLRVLEGTLSPSQIVTRLLDHYSELYGKMGYPRGDPLGGRLFELSDTHPELADKLRPFHAAWLALVTQKIWAYATIARVPGLVDRADSLASMIWAAIQGVLMQMKIAHSSEPLEEARRVLVPMVASYVTALASGDLPE